ncbi:glycosyltransferase [Pelotomaculum propionicicum]|uniref:glycosyltransferase n=1 Tax=Pelotomaculum propionicicum TaxID=258475 RepID=UPI003B7E4453
MAGKKIDFLITDLAFGGAELLVVRLASGLQARGWQVRVISMMPPQAFEEELRSEGIMVESLDMKRGIPNPAALFKLLRLLRSRRPDVVHCHMFHANLLGRISRKPAGIAVLISTIHNMYEGARWRELANRYTATLSDVTTIISRKSGERMVRVGAISRDRLKVIPNGVDTVRYSCSETARMELRDQLNAGDSFIWLAVGRFAEAKDHANMIRAYQRTRQARGDTLLLLVGEGGLRRQAEDLAEELGLSGQVRFLGVRSDIPALMSAADAYLMSSSWEGMPLVLLEAASCRLPVVATDVGGNSEVVVDGTTGILAPPKDPEKLAAAMIRLMELTDEGRQEMGLAGREYVEEHYSLDRMTDRWEELYYELIKRKVM